MTPIAEITVALAKVRPWPGNPRKTFDEQGLSELADSIKSKGILQPLLVRRMYKNTKGAWLPTSSLREDLRNTMAIIGFEIADGERRYRAAKLAGVAEVPVRVLELTDRDMLEIAVVSFEQRADISPLEKCDGYLRLIDEHGVTLDELAARIGRSVNTIRGVLRLKNLPGIARRALQIGFLPMATCELIARVPGAKSREAAAVDIIMGECYSDPTLQDAEHNLLCYEQGNAAYQSPLSFRDAKDLVRRHYQRELKQAQFSRKALDLVAEAGSCDECPKRAGNDPELAAEGVRADVCTDPECFEAKAAAHQAKLREGAEADGKTVIAGKEAKGIFQYGLLSDSAPYVDPDAKCYQDPKQRTFRKILGKQLKDAEVLVEDEHGALRPLWPRASVAVALGEKGVKVAASTSRPNERHKPDPAEQRRKADEKIKAETSRRCLGEIAARAEEAFGKGNALALTDILVAVVPSVAEELWSVTQGDVLRRRGKDVGGSYDGKRKAIKALVDELCVQELFGLLIEMGCTKSVTIYPDKAAKILKAVGVDRKAIEKQVRDEAKEKKATKAKPAPSAARVSKEAERHVDRAAEKDYAGDGGKHP